MKTIETNIEAEQEVVEVYYPVKNWQEAKDTVQMIIKGESATLGVQYDYPAPYAVFEKQAHVDEGSGFWVWNTEFNQLKNRIANVDVVKKEKEE